MPSQKLERALFWIVRIGAFVLPFSVLVLSGDLFFPYITGKNFLFRVIVELITASWVGLLFINPKKYWPRWNVVSIALFVFVFVLFVASLFGVDFYHSFWSNFERMDGVITHLHILALFFVLTGTFKTRNEWIALLCVSIGVSSLLAFYGLLEYAGVLETSGGSGSRILSTLGNPLYVAAYLSFHIFLIAFLWLYTRLKSLKWLLGMLFIFELSVFFLTGARGAFLGMLGGVGVTFLLWLFAVKDGKKRMLLVGMLIFLILIPISLHIFKDTSFIKNNAVIARFANISLKDSTVQARFTIWGMAFEAFKERPVLGWGVGNFVIPYTKHYNPAMFGNEAWFDRTHSMPFEWLSSTGIIGFLAYLALLGSMVWALCRATKHGILKQSALFIFIGMLVAYVVQMLFVFDTLATHIMMALMLGFFYTASIVDEKTWLREDSFPDTSYDTVEVKQVGFENKSKREVRRLHRNQTENLLSSSSVVGVVMSFVIVIMIIVVVNVRPFSAASSLIDSFRSIAQRQYGDAKDYFEKSLEFASGSIGVEEVREHIAINALQGAVGQSDFLQPGDKREFYLFAIEQLEKQIEQNSKKHIKIKQNILLAQLYYGLGIADKDEVFVRKSLDQFADAITFAPSYIGLYPLITRVFAGVGDINQATLATETAYNLLHDVDKYNGEIFYNRALLYVIGKRYDDAYNALESISEAHGRLGHNTKEAEDREGEDVLVQDGGMQEIYAHAGPNPHLDSDRMPIVLNAVNNNKGDVEAIPFLERIYILDKSITATSLLLAQVYAQVGNIQKAEFYAKEALAQDNSLEDKINQFFGVLKNIKQQNSTTTP